MRAVLDARVFAEDTPIWVAPIMLGVGVICWTYVTSSLMLPASAVAGSPAVVTVEEPVAKSGLSGERRAVIVEKATPEDDFDDDVVEIDDDLTVEDADDGNVRVLSTAAPSGLCAGPLAFIFEPGESVPSDLDEDAWRAFSGVFEQVEGRIVLEGYASQEGAPATNLKLSHDRAMGVRKILVRRGVPSEVIVVQAFGEYRPSLADEANMDRRVLVRLEKVPMCLETPQ